MSNEIIQHHDWLPTFLAAAGDPDIVEKLKQGHTRRRQDLQGPHRWVQPAALSDRRGGEEPTARASSTSPTTATFSASAFDNWKVVFMEQRAPRNAGRLGGAVHAAAGAQAVQPADRSRSSGQTSPPTPTTTGSSTEHLFIVVHGGCHRRPSSWRPSRNSRRGRRPRRSPSIRSMEKLHVVHRRKTRDEWSQARLPGTTPRPGPPSSHMCRRSRPTGPTSCRPRSGSPCSTTTARCGPRSRSRSSSTSPSIAWPTMAEADPSLRDQQPWKAAFEKDMKWLGEAMVKHYHGDDGDMKLLDGSGAADHRRPQHRATTTGRSRPSSRRPSTRSSNGPTGSAGTTRWSSCFAISRRTGSPLHRLRRRPGLHAADRRPHLRDPAGADHRELPGPRLPGARGRHRRPLQGGDGVLRRRPDQAGAHLEPDRATPDRGRG